MPSSALPRNSAPDEVDETDDKVVGDVDVDRELCVLEVGCLDDFDAWDFVVGSFTPGDFTTDGLENDVGDDLIEAEGEDLVDDAGDDLEEDVGEPFGDDLDEDVGDTLGDDLVEETGDTPNEVPLEDALETLCHGFIDAAVGVFNVDTVEEAGEGLIEEDTEEERLTGADRLLTEAGLAGPGRREVLRAFSPSPPLARLSVSIMLGDCICSGGTLPSGRCCGRGGGLGSWDGRGAAARLLGSGGGLSAGRGAGVEAGREARGQLGAGGSSLRVRAAPALASL
jgi:hypothetical protein